MNNKLNKDTLKQLEKINEILLDRIYSIQPIENILLDLDSTNLETFGK